MDERENLDDLKRLLALAVVGGLTQKDRQRLSRLVCQDDTALEHVIDQLEVEALLQWHHGSVRVPPARTAKTRTVLRYVTRPTALSLAVAALAMVLLISAMAFIAAPIYQHWTKVPDTSDERTLPQVVAKLTGVSDVAWAEGQLGVRTGAYLQAGHRMVLQEGLAEVTFRSGVRVTIEGPAILTLDRKEASTLRLGKLVAFVPADASGFSILTKSAVITDLGTEFGVVVEEDGTTDVHVHQGQVLVEGNDGRHSVRRLAANQSLRFTPDGQLTNLEHLPDLVHDIRLGGARGMPILVVNYTYVGDNSDPQKAKHGDYTPYDDGAQKLTDGEFGSRVCGDHKWVGWFDSQTLAGGDQGLPQPSILFDLGEPAEIDSLQISYAVEHQNGVHAPDRVAILVSDDGRSFTPLAESDDFDDTWTFTGPPVLGRAVQRVAAVELGGMKSRFVRLDFYNDNQWTFLSEVVFLK